MLITLPQNLQCKDRDKDAEEELDDGDKNELTVFDRGIMMAEAGVAGRQYGGNDNPDGREKQDDDREQSMNIAGEDQEYPENFQQQSDGGGK